MIIKIEDITGAGTLLSAVALNLTQMISGNRFKWLVCYSHFNWWFNLSILEDKYSD